MAKTGIIMNGSSIGIDLGGTKLLLMCQTAEEILGTGPSFSPDDLMRHVKAFVARHGEHPGQVGLAVPGLVDARGGIVACDVLPSFKGWPAAQAMQDVCTRVVVLNDVKAAFLEEMHDAPAGLTGGVIMIGTAIGAAFMAHGVPLSGTSGWAGELGYLPIWTTGGVRRLDDMAGGAAIAESCGMTPAMVAARASAGDAAVLRAIEAAGQCLGLGLAAVINLLNPSRLVLGGGTCELPGYWPAALASAEAHSLAELWQDCTITKVRAGKQVVALGAARAADRY
jgi:predicted NBD/HSP70 family sugar kinase